MKRKDNGWKNHYKALKQLSSMKVQVGAVGMHATEPGQKPISNASILFIHGVGVPSRNIPARMPVRKGLYENVAYLSKLTLQLLSLHHSKDGFDTKKIGDGIGNAMKNIIQATIMSRLSPALSEKYRARKVAQGFSDIPLIKTEQLKKSIDYGVVS